MQVKRHHESNRVIAGIGAHWHLKAQFLAGPQPVAPVDNLAAESP